MISLLCNTRKCLSSQKITEKLFEFISFVFYRVHDDRYPLVMLSVTKHL